MANQSPSEKKDRNGGGDVTKATEVSGAEGEKTKWLGHNNTGPGRFNPNGE